MRYKKPFTTGQREHATRVYRCLCFSFESLRNHFRPRTADQRLAARELRQTIEEIASTLRSPDDKVNVRKLNELQERATLLATEYSSDYLE